MLRLQQFTEEEQEHIERISDKVGVFDGKRGYLALQWITNIENECDFCSQPALKRLILQRNAEGIVCALWLATLDQTTKDSWTLLKIAFISKFVPPAFLFFVQRKPVKVEVPVPLSEALCSNAKPMAMHLNRLASDLNRDHKKHSPPSINNPQQNDRSSSPMPSNQQNTGQLGKKKQRSASVPTLPAVVTASIVLKHLQKHAPFTSRPAGLPHHHFSSSSIHQAPTTAGGSSDAGKCSSTDILPGGHHTPKRSRNGGQLGTKSIMMNQPAMSYYCQSRKRPNNCTKISPGS